MAEKAPTMTGFNNLNIIPFPAIRQTEQMPKITASQTGTFNRALARLLLTDTGGAETDEQSGQEPPRTAAQHGALWFDPSVANWKECLPITGADFVGPDDYPDLAFLEQAPFQVALEAAGKLMNESAGHSESGFWVQPGVFVTALHFSRWQNPQPSDSEIQQFVNDPLSRTTVSIADVNENGSRDDKRSIPVALREYSIPHDLGVFVPEDLSRMPKASIALEAILEAHEVQGMLTELQGARVFAVGYNGPPDQELSQWIRQYEQQLPANAHRVELLHPYRKTITHGTICGLSFDEGKISVDCTLYKGYSGALIGVRDPRALERLLIIGNGTHMGSDSSASKR
ncbi:hypothetical protein ABW21_db0205871 [Orbilia brochopaga]|nr:hypothetical protein ABW21_db0205871 [Drechslerella brochopaga]